MSNNIGVEFFSLKEFRNRQASASTAPVTVSLAAASTGGDKGADAGEAGRHPSVEMAAQPELAPTGGRAGARAVAAVTSATGEIIHDAGDRRFLAALQTHTPPTMHCLTPIAPAVPPGAASTTCAGNTSAGSSVPQQSVTLRDIMSETEPVWSPWLSQDQDPELDALGAEPVSPTVVLCQPESASSQRPADTVQLAQRSFRETLSSLEATDDSTSDEAGRYQDIDRADRDPAATVADFFAGVFDE